MSNAKLRRAQRLHALERRSEQREQQQWIGVAAEQARLSAWQRDLALAQEAQDESARGLLARDALNLDCYLFQQVLAMQTEAACREAQVQWRASDLALQRQTQAWAQARVRLDTASTRSDQARQAWQQQVEQRESSQALEAWLDARRRHT